MSDAAVVRIKPFHYIHVLDNNTNVTRVEVGPLTFTRQDHEKIVEGPTPMMLIPPHHYAIIQNPIERKPDGTPVIAPGSQGQVKIQHGDEEIRLHGEPFPLYPGESLFGKISPLQVVAPNTALRLRALRDFVDTEAKVKRLAGDEWLFKGPGTYMPRIQVSVLDVVKALVVKPLQALRLRAKKDFNDHKAGDEWLYTTPGAYLPEVEEEVVASINAFVLTETKALQLRALRTFTDVYKKNRKAGEEWLVTNNTAEYHIPDVNEQVVGAAEIIILTSREYCVIQDPVDVATGKTQMGARILRKGEASFFLQPGERLQNGIQKVNVLDSEEALLLRAREAFLDGAVERKPGDLWMIQGPCDYVPPVTVEIVSSRRRMPFDANEGVYVRDVTTGKVRVERGKSYLLTATEELWEKDLPPTVEEILAKEASAGPGSRLEGKSGTSDKSGRDKTRLVTFKAPHNTAVQIYDYKAKEARVVFGPDLIMLGPDEQFTLLSLSGDKPKRPHVIKAIALQLGPDFMTDIVIVETADHARLSLQLSYNWQFDVKVDDPQSAKMFSVPDFVGDACKAIGALVRGAVAGCSFDEFHKYSAKIIRTAVFGVDPETKKVKNKFHFTQNNLIISNIDIQSVEPVDAKTREALQKYVQLAIEITTKSQEGTARHEAERREQRARGRLERQKIDDDANAEEARREFLSLQAQSAAVTSMGEATAEAQAKAEAAEIAAEAEVDQARQLAKAEKVVAEAELIQLELEQKAEIDHKKALTDLEIRKARELAIIENAKFKQLVESIGSATIEAIATSGPQMQANMLKGLGLQQLMITDGSVPINLFNGSNGPMSLGQK